MDCQEEKQFLITDVLYSGNGCKIYKCRENNMNNQVDYCIKRYFVSSDRNCKIYLKAINELKVMLTLAKQHDNILDLEKYHTDESSVMLIFKYTPKRDLHTYLANNRLSKNQVKSLLFNILKGVNFLHKNNIIHGDIKLENILLFEEDGQIYPKICDFNNAVIMDNSKFSSFMGKINSEFGSNNYLPPEILYQFGNLSTNSDMWSFGVLAFYLTYNEFPFDYSSSNLEIDMIKKTYKNKFLRKNGKINNLIENLLEFKVESRISSNDLLDHPFFIEKGAPQIRIYKMNRKKFYLRLMKKSDSKLEIKVQNARIKCFPKVIKSKCLFTFTKLDNCLFNSLHEPSPLNLQNSSLLNFLRSPIQYETRLSEYVSPSSYTNMINNMKTKRTVRPIDDLQISNFECVMIKLKLKIKIAVKLSLKIVKENVIKNIAASYSKNDKLMLLHSRKRIYVREIEENINYLLGKKFYLHIDYKEKDSGENKGKKLKSFNFNFDTHFLETLVKRYSSESKERMWRGEMKYIVKINGLNTYN
jgi:serine/threonine protein kinase